jgi:iron complex transport system substrate-binding protein
MRRRSSPVPRTARLLALGLALASAATAGTALVAAGPSAAGAVVPVRSERFRPVTIEHRYGSTRVAHRPRRIVSLDPQWTDVLLAMGVTPVGHIRSALADGDFPWQGDELADSTVLPYTNAIPLEEVAALQPDLIVATYSVEDEDMYKSLRAIAPTIPSITDHEVETWQDLTKVTGKILGTRAKATKVVAGVDAEVRAFAARFPGLAGKTIAFANYVPGSELVVLADPDDGANALFAELGLELAPGIRAEAGDTVGRLEVSLERIDLLDADVLAVLTNGADLDDIPGWNSLPAVETGAVTILDMDSATALNTPSPLSIPYGLKVIKPALTHATAS